MRLLVIGGGRFFGRALVEAAIADGHDVTAVQRGQTSSAPPPGVELLQGDRDTDLPGLLGDREFDWVVDTCGYFPRSVQISADLLSPKVGRYLFISSVSAYKAQPGIRYTEDVSALDETPFPDATEVTGENYGALKTACEHVVMDVYGDRGLVVRPGLIVGPNDPSDRFTYWPRRLSEPGPVLMPVGPDFRFQVIDARDLARFCLTLLEAGRTGAVNGVSQEHTLGELVTASGTDAEIAWADEAWLLEREVGPWIELPVWLDADSNVNSDESRAFSWGLTIRPLSETVADTLAWDRSRGLPEMPNTLKREKESQLIAELGSSQP